MVWFTLALFVVSFLVTAFLSPKPKVENARPGSLDDFRAPRAEEGSPVPLIFGRVRLRAPNTLWYGDFTTTPMTQKVKTGLFSSKTQITGFQYSVTLHLGLCLGPGVTLHRFWCDKDEIWSGTAGPTGEQTINIQAPGLFGGNDGGGGLGGNIRYYGGAFDQPQNALLNSRLNGSATPAYRGLAHLVFENFYIGTAPQLRPFSFEVSRYPNNLGLPVGVRILGDDLNPAEAVYDLLVNKWGGMGIDPAEIDGASFIAVANTLAAEGNGISLVVSRPNGGKQVMEEILRQIDGVLYQDPATARIVIRLVRQDYSLVGLPVFSPANVTSVRNFSRTSWEDTTNQVRVQYTNRANKYENGMAMVQDLANISNQGRVRGSTVSFPGVTNGSLAVALATREMAQLGVPMYKCTLELNRSAAALRPGDPFILSWPDYGITQVVMRVQRFNLGELLDGKVIIEAMQDEFATLQVVYAPPALTGFTAPNRTPVPITSGALLEAPNWLVRQFGLSDPGANLGYGLALARRPNAGQIGWRAKVSQDSFATITIDAAEPFTAWPGSFVLETAITSLLGFSTGVVSLLVSQPVPSTFFAGASLAAMRAGTNLFAMNDELFSYETFTDNGNGTWTLNNVRRGLLDTAWTAHATGSVAYVVTPDGLADFPTSATIANQARLWSQTDKGESALFATSRTFNRRYERPLPPDFITVNGLRNEALSFIEGSTLNLTWLERNRLSDTIAFESDGSVTPEASTTYTLYFFRDNTQIASVPGLASASTTFPLPTGAGAGRLELEANRAGTVSLTRSTYPFTILAAVYSYANVRLFDTYTLLTVRGSWGLLQRVSTYSGPLVRIRDSLTNIEQDVGFNATTGELNGYTISGGAEARVVRLYDQSGNGNHLEETTAARQPLLLPTGLNGRPCIDFGAGGGTRVLTGVLTGNDSAPLPIMQPAAMWLAAIERGTSTSPQGTIAAIPHAFGSHSNPFYRMAFFASTLSGRLGAWDTLQYDSSVIDTGTRALILNRGTNSPLGITFIDNLMARQTTITRSSALSYPNTTTLRLGAHGNLGEQFPGKFVEITIATGVTDFNNYEPAMLTELHRGLVQRGATHRYWRVQGDFLAGGSGVPFSASGVELRATIGGANIATGGTASASSVNTTNVAANAFDASTTTNWVSNTNGPGSWLQYDFGSGASVRVNEVAWRARSDANWATQSPFGIRVQWSDNGTTWFTEWAAANDSAWTSGQTKLFANPSP